MIPQYAQSPRMQLCGAYRSREYVTCGSTTISSYSWPYPVPKGWERIVEMRSQFSSSLQKLELSVWASTTERMIRAGLKIDRPDSHPMAKYNATSGDARTAVLMILRLSGLLRDAKK